MNYTSSLINNRNFTLSSRRDAELVVLPRQEGETKKSGKISLPEGNLDLAQSLRYVSSVYMYTLSSTSLDLGLNQDFNLVKMYNL